MTSPIQSGEGDAVSPPSPGGATPEAVQAWLGPMDEDADVLAETVDAVNSLVVEWKGPAPASGWPAHVTRGLNMLAARLIRRRNSPAGVEAAGELGPLYVQRNDPDVAMLLGLGTYSRPMIG